MGKGSNQRPTDMAAYGTAYDRIFSGEALPSFGFVVTDPDNFAVAAHRRPTPVEQAEIDTYRERYKRSFFGDAPQGVHVLPISRLTVFLPTE